MVGSGETLARALELLATDGTVVMLGVQPRLDLELAQPYRLLNKREGTITGSVAKTARDFE
jgi:D-arabinose 1-dehydrogenase-like Zn-dependent alcohol dehydrogenase